MLVLSRKLRESIRIGDATVTVVRISPGRAKLAIEAPRDVVIARTELLGRATAGKERFTP
uniref:Putative carbon storage regulator n=1 Tax=viral metagenome TaxID=1070528 RepID=A0A6M3KVH2_9ZZZZ